MSPTPAHATPAQRPSLRDRRGAFDFPAGSAAIIGGLVGLSLVLGAFGGIRWARTHGAESNAATGPNGVVVPDSSGAMGANCASLSVQSKSPCYRQLLDQRIASGGVASALTTLRALMQSDPDVEREAHMYAHGIGIDAFRRQPDIDATFTHCTAEFSSGCYHGVLQAYFDMHGTADPKFVSQACQPYEASASTRWLLFQCLHGMGHGLNMALRHDLPKALTACDLLGERWHRESCYGGAFMENITHVTEPDHPATMLTAAHEKMDEQMGGMSMSASSRFRAVDSADHQYPCSIVAQRYGRECYRIQTALMLYLNRGSMSKTVHDCDHAPRDFRANCYESLGRDISAFASYQPEPAVRLCTTGNASYRQYCYAGAAETFVDEKAKPEAGFAVCSDIPRNTDKPACYERVGELIISLAATDPARAQMCVLPRPEDMKACRRGAQLAEGG